MSGKRREIAERHLNEPGAKCKCPHCAKTMESAMSEYAAAVLEEAAKDMWMLADKNEAANMERAGGIRIAAQRLERCAAQERTR